MVIGNRQVDDVELMRGNYVPATRLEVDGKVSLFDLSEQNKEKLLQWDNMDEVVINPAEFDLQYSDKRVRDLQLIKLMNYLEGK